MLRTAWSLVGRTLILDERGDEVIQPGYRMSKAEWECIAPVIVEAVNALPLCNDCESRVATEVWDASHAPIPNPPPALHLCAPCADARRDRAAERAAEEAA